jgi:hypothetical protein
MKKRVIVLVNAHRELIKDLINPPDYAGYINRDIEFREMFNGLEKTRRKIIEMQGEIGISVGRLTQLLKAEMRIVTEQSRLTDQILENEIACKPELR